MGKPCFEIYDSDGNIMLDMATFANVAIGICNIPSRQITKSTTNGIYNTVTYRSQISLISPIDFECLPVSNLSSKLDNEWWVANPWFVIQSITQGGIQIPSVGGVVAVGNTLYLSYSFTCLESGNTSGVKVLVGLGN